MLIRNGIPEMLLLSSNYLIHTLQRAAAERVRQQRGANQEVRAFSGLSRDAQCCIRFPCLLVLLHGTTYQSEQQIPLVLYIPVSERPGDLQPVTAGPGSAYVEREYETLRRERWKWPTRQEAQGTCLIPVSVMPILA